MLSAVHPEYRVWTRDRNPNLNVEFTPYASPDEVRRLSQFDLSCITRRRRCDKPAQLMPNAWKQLTAESAAYKPQAVWVNCNEAEVELLSRDAENIGIVSIVGHGFLADPTLGQLHDVTLQPFNRGTNPIER